MTPEEREQWLANYEATKRQAVDAVLAAHATVRDMGGWIADVLASAAAQLGSSHALVAGRPGSWEASFVMQLVQGTVGYGDEYLADHRLS